MLRHIVMRIAGHQFLGLADGAGTMAGGVIVCPAGAMMRFSGVVWAAAAGVPVRPVTAATVPMPASATPAPTEAAALRGRRAGIRPCRLRSLLFTRGVRVIAFLPC